MQKVINIMAVSSFVVSLTMVAGAGFVYSQRDAIKEQATEQVTELITDAVGGAVGDLPNLMGGGDAGGLPAPGSPAGSGFPIPF